LDRSAGSGVEAVVPPGAEQLTRCGDVHEALGKLGRRQNLLELAVAQQSLDGVPAPAPGHRSSSSKIGTGGRERTSAMKGSAAFSHCATERTVTWTGRPRRASSAVVGLAAALASDKIASRWGVGRLIIAGQTSMALGGVPLAAVAGPTLQAGTTMLAAEAAIGVGLSFYGVGSRTLNQTRIPVDLRSCVIGASWVFTVSLVALAGIVGGAIGTTIGLRPTMEVGATGMILALVATPRRSVWRVQATAQSRQI
jgi:hypothetical protein